MANGLAADQVIRLAVQKSASPAPSAGDYTEFGAGARRGLTQFDPSESVDTSEVGGLSFYAEHDFTGMGDGQIAIAQEMNDLSAPLFHGTGGRVLFFERMMDGKGSGKAVLSNDGVIQQIARSRAGGVFNYTIAIELDDPSVNGVQS